MQRESGTMHGIDPEVAGAAWLRAMKAGDFEAAWRHTDAMEAERRATGVRQAHNLVWDGRAFDGRRVLVRCLHGLGDTLQFMRFVPIVGARASELHFLVQPMLLELLQGAPGLGKVSNAWTDDPPAHDVEIEVMELAYALRCVADHLPPPYPHLRGPLREKLEIPRDGRLRVGLLWAVSAWGADRSAPIEALAPLFAVPGVRFFVLQQGDANQDDAARRFGLEPLHRRTERIAAAAAAMSQMDLVISVDAMPAHLASMLGTPTWLILKHDADWRWMQGRSDSPWYPTMRLFRQPRPGDWHALACEVAAELRDRAAATARPQSR
jgi:hypothetical protein